MTDLDLSAAIAPNTSAISILQTNSTTKLWSSSTRYLDGTGATWEIIVEKGYKCTSADVGSFVGEVWTPLDGEFATSSAFKEYVNPGWYSLYYSEGMWSLHIIHDLHFDDYLSEDAWDADQLNMLSSTETFEYMVLQRVDQVLTNYLGRFATTGELAQVEGGVFENAAEIAVLQTARVDKVWFGSTNFSDGAGNLWSTTNVTPYYLCVADPTGNQLFLGKKWIFNAAQSTPEYHRYVASGVPYFLRYSCPTNWIQSSWRWDFINQYDYTINSNAVKVVIPEDSDTPFEFVRVETASVYKDRFATMDDLSAIPQIPTNIISGWLLYDVGSNTLNTVIMSNGFLSVWEVVQ